MASKNKSNILFTTKARRTRSSEYQFSDTFVIFVPSW